LNETSIYEIIMIILRSFKLWVNFF